MSTTVGSSKTRATPFPGRVVSAEQMAQHERLVRWVVRQQWLGGLPYRDALHEGRLGLWAALQHYDPGRGTAFSTYAVPAIARAVWRAVALASGIGASVCRLENAPDQQRLISPAHPPPAMDETIDLDEVIDNAQVRSLLLDLVDGLSPRLREVVIAHHGLDQDAPQTFAAIGQVLDVSRQRVHQLHNTAILWLAHPAHSLALRRVLERHSRADYRKTLARQRQATRNGRRRGLPSPARQTRGG